MKQMMNLALVCGTALALFSACSKDSEKAAGDEAAKPVAGDEASAEQPEAPSFAIEAERVVVTSTLAPNATYAEQGLGLEAEEGQTFVCAFYSIANEGKAPAMAPAPKLVAADGTEYQESVDAAGKLPSEWERSFALGDVEPGASQSGPRCYQVPAEAAEGDLKLRFEASGTMGSKADDWETTVDLPAAEAEGEAAEGEDEAAAEGEDEAAAEGEAAEPTE